MGTKINTEVTVPQCGGRFMITFHFNMTRHLRPGNDIEAMGRIADWVFANTNPPGTDPDWVHEDRDPSGRPVYTGYRIAYVNGNHPAHPGTGLNHPLFEELDPGSQAGYNYLIWHGPTDNDPHIYITHFGPFGNTKDDALVQMYGRGIEDAMNSHGWSL